MTTLLCGVVLGLSPLSDPATLDPLPVWNEPGVTVTYTVTAELSSSGSTAVLATTSLQTPGKPVDGKVTWDVQWKGTTMQLDGLAYPYPPESKGTLVRNADGSLDQVTGGLPIIDQRRLWLAAMFVPPAVRLTQGEAQVLAAPTDLPADAPASTMALSRSTTWLGYEDGPAGRIHQFLVALKDARSAFRADTRYWVHTSGQVHRLTATVQGLPVPSLGVTLEGTVKAELVRS